jgi:hypothetical protein
MVVSFFDLDAFIAGGRASPELLCWAMVTAEEERRMSIAQEAERAYGPTFVPKAKEVCLRLGIPLDWLLAAMYWETTHFKSKGPPWPVNKGDGGGGLIGFTPLKGHPAEFKGPVEQLDFVEQHYRTWMKKLNIPSFTSAEDLYLIVRGPYGIGKPDTYNMGGGKNEGQVLKIYRAYLSTVLVAPPSPRLDTCACRSFRRKMRPSGSRGSPRIKPRD